MSVLMGIFEYFHILIIYKYVCTNGHFRIFSIAYPVVKDRFGAISVSSGVHIRPNAFPMGSSMGSYAFRRDATGMMRHERGNLKVTGVVRGKSTGKKTVVSYEI